MDSATSQAENLRRETAEAQGNPLRGPRALCVNALASLLGVTQSAVSQHLRILKSIGLVKGERRGYHIHYFINSDALERCRNLVSATLMIEESSKRKNRAQIIVQ